MLRFTLTAGMDDSLLVAMAVMPWSGDTCLYLQSFPPHVWWFTTTAEELSSSLTLCQHRKCPFFISPGKVLRQFLSCLAVLHWRKGTFQRKDKNLPGFTVSSLQKYRLLIKKL